MSKASGVMISVSSVTPVTDLEFIVRDIDYNVVPALSYHLNGRDITTQPLTLLIAPAAPINGRFLLHVKGYANGQYVAMDSNVLAFVPGQQVNASLRLYSDFVDADDDGFVVCTLGKLCDCDDHNDHINPFTVEDCNDSLDNDCSGPPVNRGCPCAEGTQIACTDLPASYAASAGIGACYFGALTCTGGTYSATCVSGVPTAEVPNNFIDDNCDGSVDEGSPCQEGVSRPCHLGFVDDPNNPDVKMRLAASQGALGICGDANHHPYGKQTCMADGSGNWVWGKCNGDIYPQRNTRPGETGWAEAPADPMAHTLGQCDGLDNDCDGVIDDAPEYDADRDGYKVCGTDPNMTTIPRVNPELVDCDDANPRINPGATEVCGNTIDEDCRCDHDPNQIPAGQAGSVIGAPSVRTDGTAVCPSDDAYLRCGVLPRSDGHPTGSCQDGPDPYYAGFYGANQDCYLCSLAYGLNCTPASGSCSVKAADCASCAGSPPGNAVGVSRPTCRVPRPNTCLGGVPPAFTDITGADPFDDCGSVSCSGYYAGIANGRCYGKSDVAAPSVVCKAGGQCQGATDLCPGAAAQSTPVAAPICTQIASGCAGTTAPVFIDQPAGQDLFNECTQSFNCSDNESAGGGPFYFGIVGNDCYFRANVSKNSCDGAGLCQSRAAACSRTGMGSAVPGRPVCTVATTGCDGTTGPTYGFVAAGEDPFNECGGRGCDGAGACLLPRGGGCSSNNQCASGYCVDGVCCNSSCTGTCQACSNNLTGQSNGLCANISQNVSDPGTCQGTQGCIGSACTCIAGTGTCGEGLSGTCNQNSDCISGHCNCSDAACDTKRCDTVDCDCRYDTNSDGRCDGFVQAGVVDSRVCAATTVCNGSGVCARPR